MVLMPDLTLMLVALKSPGCIQPIAEPDLRRRGVSRLSGGIYIAQSLKTSPASRIMYIMKRALLLIWESVDLGRCGDEEESGEYIPFAVGSSFGQSSSKESESSA